jgi:hypothetical protein
MATIMKANRAARTIGSRGSMSNLPLPGPFVFGIFNLMATLYAAEYGACILRCRKLPGRKKRVLFHPERERGRPEKALFGKRAQVFYSASGKIAAALSALFFCQ